ncbi:MAG: Sec-independent protein translocase protein TatB [Lysobacterales bacterium]|jgi:sec-independent protein translocase protein TatB
MFDIGFTEILLLSLVGLMVLGPERLPRVARTLGRMAQKARASWLSLRRQVEAEMRAEDMKIPIEKFQKNIKDTVDNFRSEATGGERTSKPAASSEDAAKSEDATDPQRD